MNKGVAVNKWFCALLIALSPAMAFALQDSVIGTARAINDNTVLYDEHHINDVQRNRRSVSYRRDGVEFAAKKVDYQFSAIAPAFEQHDKRRGEFAGARYRGNSIELGFRETDTDDIEWTAIKRSERPLVIDAGFDNFVRQQWNQLRSESTVDFDFAVPSRAQAVHLAIQRAPLAKCGAQSASGSSCFKVYAANYVVRLFFSPLYLLYDENQQLARFSGLSNINDEKGDGQRVRIDYR